MLENFTSYKRQKGEECSVILTERNNIHKPQGQPKFPSIFIRLALSYGIVHVKRISIF